MADERCDRTTLIATATQLATATLIATALTNTSVARLWPRPSTSNEHTGTVAGKRVDMTWRHVVLRKLADNEPPPSEVWLRQGQGDGRITRAARSSTPTRRTSVISKGHQWACDPAG